jgi:hypothetical protein
MALLATPTNLRRVCEDLKQRQHQLDLKQQQQQLEPVPGPELDWGPDIVSLTQRSSPRCVNVFLDQMAYGLSSVLRMYAGEGPACDKVMRALSSLGAVMDVYGAAGVTAIIQHKYAWCFKDDLLLLRAVHSKWLAGMPWLQSKWRVTNRLQQLVGQPLQQLLPMPPLATKKVHGTARATSQEPQQVSGGRQPSDVCLCLWTEAEAAADGGDWQLFVARLEQLTGLRPGWVTYPLAEFAAREGRGESGVLGLSEALLVSWWEAQQPTAKAAAQRAHARDMAAAVVAAVQTWEQQGMGVGCSSRCK